MFRITCFWQRNCTKLKRISNAELWNFHSIIQYNTSIKHFIYLPIVISHIHHAKSGGGQILVCVAGRGYYQEEGNEAIEMKPGDCINIPTGVKHWHGAAPDEWFSHLAIEVPSENGSNEWLEPVSDEEYGKLQ